MFTRLQHELDERAAQGLLRRRHVLESAQGAHVMADGKPYLSFCSNDYLGLANHPQLIAALQQGAQQWGVGAGASHLVSGHFAPHHQLEAQLAAFAGKPAALLFSSGYLANLGAVQALAGRGDTVFADKLNHASLNDAMLLSRAAVRRYRHNDMAQLEQLLAQARGGRKLVITDAVFSMDGDLAPLPQLLALCEQHDAWLLVDDAHGFGVLGEQGRGALFHFKSPSLFDKGGDLNPDNPLEPNPFLPPCTRRGQAVVVKPLKRQQPRTRGKVGMGVEQWNDSISTPSLALPLQGGGNISAKGLFRLNSPRIIYMATLGKAAGVSGAFVAAEQVVIDTLVNHARSYVYTTASPPALAVALLQSLQLIGQGDERRAHLHSLIGKLRAALAGLPWKLMPSDTAIQPLLVGGNEEAVVLSEGLRARGIRVPAIRPPTVPPGTARLRISLSAAHSADDVAQLADALHDLAQKNGSSDVKPR